MSLYRDKISFFYFVVLCDVCFMVCKNFVLDETFIKNRITRIIIFMYIQHT